MKRLIIALLLLAAWSGLHAAVTKTAPSGKPGCLACHDGIEDIRDDKAPMMLQIKAIGAANGDPEGCVTCHGGNPKGTTLEDAHKGSPQGLKAGNGPKTFYPDPCSVWIADNTCGQSHIDYA